MNYVHKVSIIVPVYNVKKKLSACLNSILNQTYKNIEIILIDNGSTDGSEIICEEYAKKYGFIKYKSQDRRGPSATRNKGIDEATGKYLQFVDSDDILEHNMTKKLVDAMQNQTNLVICGINTLIIDGDKTEINVNKSSVNGEFKIEKFNNHLFGELFIANLINSPCNKLYVTELINNSNLRFLEDIEMGEDLLFNLEYLRICNSIAVLNDGLYNYLKYKYNSSSLTGNFKDNFFEIQQLLYKRVREYLVVNNSYDINKSIIETAYTNSIIGCFENLVHNNSKYDSISVKREINKIITNDVVNRNIEYFYGGNIQKRLLGYLIRKKNSDLIFVFIKLKTFVRNKLTFIFNLLKNINNSIK